MRNLKFVCPKNVEQKIKKLLAFFKGKNYFFTVGQKLFLRENRKFDSFFIERFQDKVRLIIPSEEENVISEKRFAFLSLIFWLNKKNKSNSFFSEETKKEFLILKSSLRKIRAFEKQELVLKINCIKKILKCMFLTKEAEKWLKLQNINNFKLFCVEKFYEDIHQSEFLQKFVRGHGREKKLQKIVTFYKALLDIKTEKKNLEIKQFAKTFERIAENRQTFFESFLEISSKRQNSKEGFDLEKEKQEIFSLVFWPDFCSDFFSFLEIYKKRSLIKEIF